VWQVKRIFWIMGTLLILASGACGYFLYQNQQLYHHSLEQAEKAIVKKDYRNAAIHVERALFLKKGSKEALAYKQQLEPAMALSEDRDMDLAFVNQQIKKILQIPQGSAELKAQARTWQEEVTKLNDEKKEWQNNLTELKTALQQNNLVKAETELESLNKADDGAQHLTEICEQRDTLALEFEMIITKKSELLQKDLDKAKEWLTLGNYEEAASIITPIATKENAKALADVQLEAKKLYGIIQQHEEIEKAM